MYSIHQLVIQFQYRSFLPVGYCFPASSSLFMEDHNNNTTHFHIPQWLPLTVVPMIRYSNTRNIWPIVVDHGAIDNNYDLSASPIVAWSYYYQ